MSSHRLTLTPIYLLLKISAIYALLAAIVRWVKGNHQACFLLSHSVFLVLAIINVANTSVHRLCLCECLVRVCVCVWAGTSGVRVKWVVGRWQHGDHYQKGNACFCHSLLGEQTHNVLICQSWLANHWLQTLFIVSVFVLLKYYLYHYWHQRPQKKALTRYLEFKFYWILLNLFSFQVGKWRGGENKKRGSGFSQSCIEGQTDGQVTGAGSGISGDKTERFPSGNCCNFDSSSSRVRILIATSIYMAGWCSHSLPLLSLCVLVLFFPPLFCIFHHGRFAQIQQIENRSVAPEHKKFIQPTDSGYVVGHWRQLPVKVASGLDPTCLYWPESSFV